MERFALLKALWSFAALTLAFAAPAKAADLPSNTPAPANPYTIDPQTTSSADLWKGFYVGSGVSASFAKGAKSAWGGDAFAGYDHAFSSGLTLGIRVDTGYAPWASPSGRFKGFDYGETDLKLGYEMGAITPYVVAGVALAKSSALNGFSDGGSSANALFSGPGALQAVGVAGVGVDYHITSNVTLGVAAYMSGGSAAFGR
jgi:opacity protein-like surface antigen